MKLSEKVLANKGRLKSVIFFDLDGTLIKGPFEKYVFPKLFCEISSASGLDVHEIRSMIVRENFHRQRAETKCPPRAMDWDEIIAEITKKLNIIIESTVSELVNMYCKPPYSSLITGARQVLSDLNSPNRAIIAATKGLAKYQIPILEALEIHDYFTDILTPETNNSLKSDRRFYGFWGELDHLKISIGDHFEDDVVAPKAFGFRSVWLKSSEIPSLVELDPELRVNRFMDNEDGATRPDALAFDLREIPKIVRRLEAAV